MTTLPTGRSGQALALAVTVIAAVIVWLGVVTPLLELYASRTEYLAEQRSLAARMASVATTAPALQRQLDEAAAAGPPPRSVLEGATDAVAGASLQQAVQDMAGHAGATVTSAEMLPPEQAGGYRRIGIHVQVTAPFPVLVTMLGETLQAQPRMLVDDLSIRPTLALGGPDEHPTEAGFTVIAFHAGAAAR